MPTATQKKLVYMTIAATICLFVGLIASFATQASVNDWYTTLNKPSFNPPNWLFAPVWTVLYVMMGAAAGIVWSKGFYHLWVKTALYHFAFQLLFNALWSIVFFGFQNPFWALIVIFILLILIVLTIRWFKIVSNTAAWLMVPYLLWVLFATALNYKIWELN